MKKWLASIFIFTIGLSSISAAAAASNHSEEKSILPLARTHAHNDYEHGRPLLDALDHGFTSVEADIWLENGELLVGHNKEDLKQERTLRSLYLNPLMKRVKENHGKVYPNFKYDITLLVDIKSEDEATYTLLHKQLRHYQQMLTRFTPRGVKPGVITVIVSGNRPRTLMENQNIRYAAYDGRMSDINSTASNQFIPLISDNWTNHFTWMGKGKMPQAEKERLNSIVSIAHAHGQKVRFWAVPDTPSPERDALWNELLKAGVDMINTDDLDGLEHFLKKNDPYPSAPHITWNNIIVYNMLLGRHAD